MDETWEDRYGEPPEESSILCWSENGFFAFWDEDNPGSPMAVIDPKHHSKHRRD